ncbi:MAG: MiaB/RimO family radical SAM methylthiotransferase [Alistipes sp.]|jgi:threonylcarbamoyladenosine tRNA methylthiotransferase MtaB|nr:MiaB/RimO family radical SAM methylthiotransferase [Alistipes sp.]
MKVSIHTLGCKVNFAESSTLAREYEAAGYERVGAGREGDEESEGRIPEADLYIVNSCSVTAAADKKCRNLVARLHRRSPAAKIIVTGCYAQRSPAEVASLSGVTEVRQRDFSRFTPACSHGDRTRSFLKVQDGCDYHCSYCTIGPARGPSRNGRIVDIVAQAREIASHGVGEIVLTGVNTGDFGRTTGESFLDLLRALDAVEGIARYRISSIEPNLLTDGVIDFCASSRAFQPHFHIPLQSGSDRILGLMRRRYTAAKFADRIERVRSVMPDTFFGVDVIVGFPGETDEDFGLTFSLLERLRPAQLHVFPYSVRPETPAAEMHGRVAPRVAAARAALLGELSQVLHSEFVARFAGIEAEVLWEGGRNGGSDLGYAKIMSGFSGNYIRVSAPYDHDKINTITKIVVSD